MLPIFLQELFTAFWLFNFSVPKWGQAAHFSARMFCSVCILQFFCWQQGEMLPIFCEKILRCFDLSFFTHAAHFSEFCSDVDFAIFLFKNGEMLAVFMRELLQHFDCSIFLIKTVEMLPIFLRKHIAVFWFCIFLFKIEGQNSRRKMGSISPCFLQERL